MNEGRSWRWILVRFELGIAMASVAIALASVLAAPPIRSGMFSSALSDAGPLVTLAGILGTIVGTAWMFRIANADPEAGPSPWRYRGED